MTKLLRLAFAILVGSTFLFTKVPHLGQVGMTLAIKDGNAQVSAGSQPIIVLWTAIAVALVAALMIRNTNPAIVGLPAWGRRVAGFVIDFEFSMVALASLAAHGLLGLEAARTGRFMWNFQRHFAAVKTDYLLGDLAVLLFMALMIFYFAFPLINGRQTVGCFIMGIKVTLPFGEEGCFTFRAAMRRTFYAFRGMCSVFERGWGRDEQGRTWWDRETNCTVVLIDDV
jgi:hypothetical protein